MTLLSWAFGLLAAIYAAGAVWIAYVEGAAAIGWSLLAWFCAVVLALCAFSLWPRSEP